MVHEFNGRLGVMVGGVTSFFVVLVRRRAARWADAERYP